MTIGEDLDRAIRARLQDHDLDVLRGRIDKVEEKASNAISNNFSLLERVAKLEAVPDDPVIVTPTPEPTPAPTPSPTGRVPLSPSSIKHKRVIEMPSLESGKSWWNAQDGIVYDPQDDTLGVSIGANHPGHVQWIRAEDGVRGVADPLPPGFYDEMNAEDGNVGSSPRLGGLAIADGGLTRLWHGSFGGGNFKNIDDDDGYRQSVKDRDGVRVSAQRTGGWLSHIPERLRVGKFAGMRYLIGCVTESIRGSTFEGPGCYACDAVFSNAFPVRSYRYPSVLDETLFTDYGAQDRKPTRTDRWQGVILDDPEFQGVLFLCTFGTRGGSSFDGQYYLPGMHSGYSGFQGDHAPPYTTELVCFDETSFLGEGPTRVLWRKDISSDMLETDRAKPYSMRASLAYDPEGRRVFVKELWPGKPEPVVHVYGIE